MRHSCDTDLSKSIAFHFDLSLFTSQRTRLCFQQSSLRAILLFNFIFAQRRMELIDHFIVMYISAIVPSLLNLALDDD